MIISLTFVRIHLVVYLYLMKKQHIFYSVILLIFLNFLFALVGHSQLSIEQHQKLDSLSLKWNTPNHPGGVIGVMQDGKTLFLKSYGLASLEYLVPNSTETKFNIASVSKQFTAMAIVLLQQQGKLSVDDDIRKYLPEVPDFGDTVTIRHMLQHTSGLRSFHALLALAGWRDDDSRTNEDLYRLMKNQKDLNFEPGDQYNYCNTGYILAAKIIENITGEKFSVWMKQNIFEPMGMINTYVEDKYNRVVPNNATSYHKTGEGFMRAVEYWGYVGSGNMHSTVNDLLKWLNNFHTPAAGWEAAFEMLKTTDNFNNGEESDYAFGVGINDYKGLQRIQHGGSIGGYRSFACTYPEQKLNIAVLTNFSSAFSFIIANKVSEIVLGDLLTEADGDPARKEQPKTMTLSSKKLQEFEAEFWNAKDSYKRKIYLRDDTLRYYRSENSESPLVPIGKSEFRMIDVEGDINVKFSYNENDILIMTLVINDGIPSVFEGSKFTPSSSEKLSEYEGEYFSPELQSSYFLLIDDDTLKYHHPRHGTFNLNEIKEGIFESSWPLNLMKFKKDDNGKITGFLVSNGRVMNMWFEKKE